MPLPFSNFVLKELPGDDNKAEIKIARSTLTKENKYR